MENNELNKTGEAEVRLIPASILKRLTNYFIDVIIFSILVSFLAVLVNPFYPLMQKIIAKQPISFTDQLMISFVYGLYMSFTEAILKGKTIAKYITGTRAVTIDGIPINSQTAFIRGLIRIIPFEQFSAISIPSRPWHDRWSNSFVVDESKSILPKNK